MFEGVFPGDQLFAHLAVFNAMAGTFHVSVFVLLGSGQDRTTFIRWVSQPQELQLANQWIAMGGDVGFTYDQIFRNGVLINGLRTTVLAQFYLSE